jgi:hypothetical protein
MYLQIRIFIFIFKVGITPVLIFSQNGTAALSRSRLYLTLNSLLLTEEFSFKRKITLLSIIK